GPRQTRRAGGEKRMPQHEQPAAPRFIEANASTGAGNPWAMSVSYAHGYSVMKGQREGVRASSVKGLMMRSRSTRATASSGTRARGGYCAGGAGFVASITIAVIFRACFVPSSKYS